MLRYDLVTVFVETSKGEREIQKRVAKMPFQQYDIVIVTIDRLVRV
jgi:hypothetical protein